MPHELRVLEIRGDSSSLTIQFTDATYVNETDEWGAGFVDVRISASVPGFSAQFTASFYLRDLLGFRDSLVRLHANLSGTAEFEAMEDFLKLTGAIDGLGHIRWSGDLRYPSGTGAELRFEIESDQSYLPALLRQLEAVFDAYL